MTTTEIISNFMKGNTKAGISEKQRNWLLSQAKRDGVEVSDHGYITYVYFEDCFYSIKQCKSLASGGSYVGTRYINGRYNIEKLLHIKFTDTGLTAVYGVYDLDHFKREGHQFEIIKPIH